MSFSVRKLSDESSRQKPRWLNIVSWGLRIGAPLIGVYKAWAHHKEEELTKHHRIVMLKKVLLILVSILCAFLVLGITIRGLMVLKVFTLGDIVSITGSPPATDNNGHTNVLLLGQGDASHAGTDLTDSIMIASIDAQDTKSVTLMSLPRDLYFLKTEKMGKGRINSMYRDYKGYLRARGMNATEAGIEAMKELSDELGRKMGMKIHHAIKVDFIGFVKVVDELDGIEVNVPEEILDTEYPNESWGYETFALNAGLQAMDGTTALKYARSRHSSSDFDRSARQQQILKAVAEKADKSGAAGDAMKIASIYRILSEHVLTTLDTREIIGLAEVGRSIDRSRMVTMQLNDRNGLYDNLTQPGGFLYTPPRNLFDGASVLLPVSIPEFPVTWRQVRTLVELIIRQRSIYIAKPQIAILNAGAPSGSARRLGNELKRYGFDINNIANADIDDQPTTTIAPIDDGNQAVALFFSVLLGIDVNPLPEDISNEERGPITILLGEDYTYTPLQNLLPNIQ